MSDSSEADLVDMGEDRPEATRDMSDPDNDLWLDMVLWDSLSTDLLVFFSLLSFLLFFAFLALWLLDGDDLFPWE